MAESTRAEFKRLVIALLERDGKTHRTGRAVQIGDLQIHTENGYLHATLSSEHSAVFHNLRLQVYNSLDDEYSIPHMSEWLPKLRCLFVLERLADL